MARSLLERLNEYKTMLNTPIGQSQGGLLSNIPQGALLGSAIFGQGIQGRDPFSALLPAVTQTAQLQKYMTDSTIYPYVSCAHDGLFPHAPVEGCCSTVPSATHPDACASVGCDGRNY